jgi:hypothetical protein
MIEEYIIKNNKFNLIDYYLREHQFSEEFLIKYIDYINEFKCLKYQKNLSKDFVMKYLYDKPSNSSDNWVSIDDVNNYFSQNNNKNN